MVTRETLTTLLQQRKYSHRTVESYGYWFDRLASHFYGRAVTDLDGGDILSFFQHLQSKRLNDQTVRSAGAALRFLFREVVRKKELAEIVPVVRPKRPHAIIPTQGQVLSCLAVVSSAQLRTALKCIYGMGLELQEVLVLRVKDIDFSANRIRVIPQRSKTARDVPIPLFVIDELQSEVREKRKSDYIFSTTKGEKLPEQRLQRAWAEARAKAGIPALISIRSLRHAYIRHLTMLGVQLKDVLHHLGLHKARTLEYYSNYSAIPTEITFSPADRLIHEIESSNEAESPSYVASARIAALVELKQEKFDFRRLIMLLQELNSASANSNYLSMAFLIRAVLDHVPPVFGCETFGQIANNYAGTKSFKRNMDHLHNALRNIADNYLHSHIRHKEDLPTFLQVDFRSQLDQLLGEIIRIA
ncbi:MAG: tyrosine-type recombinase/integrase [Methylobacter sp.]